MEDKLSETLYETNKEYLKIINSRTYKFSLKMDNFIDSLKRKDFSFLFNLVGMKLRKNKFVDNLNYLTDTAMLGNMQELDSYNHKIIVYMCIVGGYDTILEPAYISESCDYYIITDREVEKDSAWSKIDIDQFQLNGLSNSEKNRYFKLHPHKLFSNYDYSLYIDGNLRIMADIKPLVEQMGNAILGLHRHHLRDCIYTEANVLTRIKRLEHFKDGVLEQISSYEKEGYGKHMGLYENPILLRKHNDIRCIQLMEDWWAEMNRFTMRDQLSLPYIISKNGITPHDIYIMGNNLRENARFRRYKHKISK